MGGVSSFNLQLSSKCGRYAREDNPNLLPTITGSAGILPAGGTRCIRKIAGRMPALPG
jgi:hypothetical protein